MQGGEGKGFHVVSRAVFAQSAASVQDSLRTLYERRMPLLLLALLAVNPNADFLQEYARTRGYSLGRPSQVKVTHSGAYAVYLRSGAQDSEQTLYALDLATGVETTVASPQAFLGGDQEVLSFEERERRERMRVSANGIVSFALQPEGNAVVFGLGGKLYIADLPSGPVRQLATGPGACLTPSFSPDGKRVAYVRAFDVYAIDLATNEERAVSVEGTETIQNGLAEFVAQEEMSRHLGYWWSPDSSAIAYQTTDNSGVERLGLADPFHPEAPERWHAYPRAGHANARVSLSVQLIGGKAPTAVRWDTTTYPYLASVTWSDGPLTLVVQKRSQKQELVLMADANGLVAPILTESDAAWLNLDQAFPHWNQDGTFFWSTERNGAPEVELRTGNGTLARSWVQPAAGFADFVGYDRPSATLYFTGGSKPTETQLFSVTRAGTPKAIAFRSGQIKAEYFPGPKLLAIAYADEAHLPQSAVIRPNGALVQKIPSAASEPTATLNSEIRVLPKSGIWTRVTKPSNFTASRKYPVILSVYGGPGHQHVVATPALIDQWLADQGFIVVRAEGRGTPRRGRAWERAIEKDFSGIPAADQLRALRELAARDPSLDTSRTGVTGWSFGGYLSGVLGMVHGDQIKAAVLGAPVVDWHDYDTHYTERYLGDPKENDTVYTANALTSMAKNAKRPLLIFHGTADDNVFFLNTLKLSDALFRANVPFGVVPLINFTHMVRDATMTERQWERTASFFREQLGVPVQREVVPSAPNTAR